MRPRTEDEHGEGPELEKAKDEEWAAVDHGSAGVNAFVAKPDKIRGRVKRYPELLKGCG